MAGGTVPPMTLSPEQRHALEQRKAEMKTRMDELRPSLSSFIVPDEWVELYEAREAIDRQLDGDERPQSV